MMAGEVKSAAEATRIATSFFKQYYAFLRLISASRQNSTWIVEVDVGVITKEIAEVKIDASTADITGYSFPKQGVQSWMQKQKLKSMQVKACII